MSSLVRQTYIILATNNFKINKKHFWVVSKPYEFKYHWFESVDKKMYSLLIRPEKPIERLLFSGTATPYELFIKDEYLK